MSSSTGELLKTCRDLLQSHAAARVSPGGSATGFSPLHPEPDQPAGGAAKAENESPYGPDGYSDLVSLMALAEQLLRDPPGGDADRAGGTGGLVSGLREPVKATRISDLDSFLNRAVESLAAIAKGTAPGAPGAPEYGDVAADPASRAVSNDQMEPEARVSFPARPDLNFGDTELLDRLYRLLEKADGEDGADGGLLSMVILNAAMIPGWPNVILSDVPREKAASRLVRQFEDGGNLSDEEVLSYLAGFGLNAGLLKKLQEQMPSRDDTGRKIMMWLACLISIVGAIVETLHREVEDLTDRSPDDPDVGPGAAAAKRLRRDRVYLD
ncbi:hypothetical protein C8N35_111139 [Breoghania corrubedonensis]|uniref:Uncharacterized protein n=1 Tax=Breoghania corrubedonensis TaxID=665038 RepID=A0A2T5UYU9_9HYPH|nr:hypothetical protein [Breoghania corrubedonensis]PTW56676.1 hypothetical protein C8N35_111139 [Breoghania corrubedonensis]